jgi:hypothetical protein
MLATVPKIEGGVGKEGGHSEGDDGEGMDVIGEADDEVTPENVAGDVIEANVGLRWWQKPPHFYLFIMQ